jgi:hypothetical protein
MNFTIEIDMKDACRSRLRKVANDVRDTMIQLAKNNLSSATAIAYVASLSKVKVTGDMAEFQLRGWLSNAIELGCNPFDMKPGLLRSPKVKISKKGNPYLAVPIKDSVRIVSSKSKPGSWIHPGILPRDFWGKATYTLRNNMR